MVYGRLIPYHTSLLLNFVFALLACWGYPAGPSNRTVSLARVADLRERPNYSGGVSDRTPHTIQNPEKMPLSTGLYATGQVERIRYRWLGAQTYTSMVCDCAITDLEVYRGKSPTVITKDIQIRVKTKVSGQQKVFECSLERSDKTALDRILDLASNATESTISADEAQMSLPRFEYYYCSPSGFSVEAQSFGRSDILELRIGSSPPIILAPSDAKTLQHQADNAFSELNNR